MAERYNIRRTGTGIVQRIAKEQFAIRLEATGGKMKVRLTGAEELVSLKAEGFADSQYLPWFVPEGASGLRDCSGESSSLPSIPSPCVLQSSQSVGKRW